MGIKDDLSRNYFRDPERFADVFNYSLYDGDQIIDPRCLQEMDVSELLVFPEGTSLKRTRDMLKSAVIFDSGECYYALLGLELQSHIDYTMPLRDMLQNTMGYVRQCEEIAARHKQEKDLKGDAFLCGFSKKDRLKPIISVVLYLGTKGWDGPLTLHDMLGRKDRRVLEKVPNYKINLVTPDTVEDFSKFHTSFGLVYEMFKYAGDEKAMGKLLQTKCGVYASISDEDIAMIKTFLKMDFGRDKKEEQEVVELCKAWDDHYESGRRKGMEEGREEGRKEGCEEGRKEGREECKEILYSLVSEGYITEETAASKWKEWQAKYMQIESDSTMTQATSG
ncbi:MAG: Rpn family recombination-promoting nuclease/putative transposase [Lachnospiraceae bacterium]|nr:Rpn family recombination-promoting nuclease/putative transposase [Lachnospiraceae bacterium]